MAKVIKYTNGKRKVSELESIDSYSSPMDRLTGDNVQDKLIQINDEFVRNLGSSSENEIPIYLDDTGKDTKSSGIVIGQTQQGQFRPISQSGLDVVFSGGQVQRRGVDTVDLGSKNMTFPDDSISYLQIDLISETIDVISNTSGFILGNIPLWIITTSGASVSALSDRRSPYVYDKNIHLRTVTFEKPINLGDIEGEVSIASILNKIIKIRLINTTTLTLPPFSGNGTISFMLLVKQDATGGRDLTILGEGSTDAVNLSEFDFMTGAANQKCYVTLLWDSEQWAFTTSRWFD